MVAPILPIPLPSDDTDHRHAIHASLSSLHASTSAFDASLDAMQSNMARRRRRVMELEGRIARSRAALGRLLLLSLDDDNDGAAMVALFKSTDPSRESSSSSTVDGGEVGGAMGEGGGNVGGGAGKGGGRIGAGGEGGGGGGGRVGSVILRIPGSYELALLGRMLRDVEDGLSEAVAIGGMGTGRRRHDHSTRDDVRRSADAAIRAALSADITNDDGCAVPSDAYLDRPSSGLMGMAGGSIRHAGIVRAVPSVWATTGGEDDAMRGGGGARGWEEGEEEGEGDYARILDALLARNDAVDGTGGPSSSIDGIEDRLRGDDGDGDDDARSVHTTTSQLSSAVSVSSRMTSQQRRRWHKQRNAQVLHGGGSKASSNSTTSRATIPPPLYPHVEMSMRHRANVAMIGAGGGGARPYDGRRQSRLGSMPYLCEVLHDAYGIGTHPPVGLLECDGYSPSGTRECGAEFYPPTNHVTDMYVFNTSRNSYGPTSTTNTTTRTTAGLSVAGPTFGKCSASNKSTGHDDVVDDERTVHRNDVPHASIVDGTK
jgi:hypothetical protein